MNFGGWRLTASSNEFWNFGKLFIFCKSKIFAFTLAEVLITIGIIGVVAALTMPVLVQNSQKKEVSVRLKKFYSTFSQAIIKSELDNSMKDDWFRTGNLVDDDEDTQASMNYDEMAAFWNKYFAPYIKTL